jgi:hypothetical protein
MQTKKPKKTKYVSLPVPYIKSRGFRTEEDPVVAFDPGTSYETMVNETSRRDGRVPRREAGILLFKTEKGSPVHVALAKLIHTMDPSISMTDLLQGYDGTS